MATAELTPSKYYPNTCPFQDNKKEKQVTVWSTKESTINLLVCSLSGPALRVLLLIGSCTDVDGVARISVKTMANRMQVSNSLINEAIRNLILLNVVQRKAIGEFWTNPSFFSTIKILA